jgi:site-specific recombinase XerD
MMKKKINEPCLPAGRLFVKEYLSVLKLEKNLSENTVVSYKNDLTSFFRF